MSLTVQPSLFSVSGQTHRSFVPDQWCPSSAICRRSCLCPSISSSLPFQICCVNGQICFSAGATFAVSASGEDAGGSSRKGFGAKKKEKAGAGESKKAKAPEGLEQEGVLINKASTGASALAEKKVSRRLSKMVDMVDKKSSVRSRVDPAESRIGKVDFVRVQNWGAEGDESQKLEDLKVKSFSPAASSIQNKTDGPFYEKLVNRLQLLDSKGDIAVAQAKPLPSFDRWVFGEDRYVQYLVDQRSVFEALRDGVGSIRKERCLRNIDGKLEEVLPLGGAACAVGLFDMDLGLDRCEALSADISCIIDASKARGENSVASITSSTQAVGYAKYLKQLGKISVGEEKKAKEACLKLLAHLFAVYVSHLTTGTRIGAKALDNVASLKYTRALRFYREYAVQEDPLQLFVATINTAGSFIISNDDQEQVMEELAKAFQKTSLMLSVLAVVEQLTGAPK